MLVAVHYVQRCRLNCFHTRRASVEKTHAVIIVSVTWRLVCDTFVCVNADGVLFAKNSDRDANESQELEWVARSNHDVTRPLECTWIEIPQVETTNAVVLSRPWWMWGAEMGANEHGVAIGNEAVFTTEQKGEPALLGMDLVRLALERASSARESVDVIISLLERYGQGGSCSHERPGFTYHNSFLIADQRSAVVLETAGSKWAVEEVRSGARSISNGLTIKGFAEQYSDRLRATVVACSTRRARTELAARHARGPGDMMAALRDHGDHEMPTWSMVRGTLHAPCVHSGGMLASSQTTGSMVSDLRGDPLHWMTATSAPCTSVFKPVRVHEPLVVGPSTNNRFDAGSLWWRHELVHRLVLRDWAGLSPSLRDARDRLENSWLDDPPCTRDAFEQAELMEVKWRLGVDPRHGDLRPHWVRRHWRELDVAADLPTTKT